MKEIGGYFELELPKENNIFLHSDGILLNSGRHALEYILLSLEKKIKKIYLPFYTCEVVLQPIKKLNIEYEFYHINLNFELEELPELKEGEYIIVNNYFGIKDEYVKLLSEKYQDNIIIDQAQAWYAPELKDIKAFYSPRKYFGIPDGGIVVGTNNKGYNQLKQDFSWDRFTHLLKRHELRANEGYEDFRNVASLLSQEPLKKMSTLTKLLLGSIDMQSIKEKRRRNFDILEEALKNKNLISLPAFQSYECPMVYPFLIEDNYLKQKLINNRVFVATYWPNVQKISKYNTKEFFLANSLIPVPIDQRYDNKDMEYIINLITE